MTSYIPHVLVMDRKYPQKKPHSLQKMWDTLGGNWQQMFEIWEETDNPYVLFVADTAERRRSGAPLMLKLQNRAALRRAVHHVCDDLKGQQARWLILMRPYSKARAIVEAELQIDFEVGVTA